MIEAYSARWQAAGLHSDGGAAGAHGALCINAQLAQAVHQILDGPLAHARNAIQHKTPPASSCHCSSQGPAQKNLSENLNSVKHTFHTNVLFHLVLIICLLLFSRS